MELTTQSATPGDQGERTPDTDVWLGVRAILAELLNRPAGGIAPDARLDSHLGFDSLMMIELCVRLEERFDIVVPPSASPSDLSIKTAADVARVVEALVAGRDPQAPLPERSDVR